MALRNGVNGVNVDAMTTAEVYAAWGTTEEAHLEKMFAIIDRENALTHAASRKQARKSRFAGVRVAVSPAGRYGRFASKNVQGRKGLNVLALKKLKMLGIEAGEGYSPAVAEAVERALKRAADRKKGKMGKPAKGLKGYKGHVLKAAKKKK